MAANMVAIDTNVVVRFITNDDPEQAARAKSLVDSTEVSVSTTVILEAGWVLASKYRYPPNQVARVLSAFLGIDNVVTNDPRMVGRALEWVVGGLDFADALHLAQAESHDTFATFDRQLANRAADLTSIPVRLL
jgi:predicted nucleic acid-binding protein